MAFDENWERSLGRKGGTRITTTSATTGRWTAIQAVKDTTLSAVTCNIAGLAGVLLPAGMVVGGIFTSITIASGGDLIAYND